MTQKINVSKKDGLNISQSLSTTESLVNNIVKHPLRMLIFLLLYIYPELNVTEISRKLNRSKATVSRHLNAMEEDGILESREEKSIGKINPRIYKLPKETLYLIKQSSRPSKNGQSKLNLEKMTEFMDPNARLDIYQKVLGTIKSISMLISYGFQLVKPYIEIIESKMDNIDSADDVFMPLMIEAGRSLHFDAILIGENQIDEVNKLYKDYIKNVYEVLDKNESDDPKSILMLNSMLPLREVLEFGSSNEEE